MNTQRILDEMHRDIERGAVVGYGLSAWRHGEELFTLTAGLADRENNVPSARDTLYRIFSQTKPVTGVAAVMALESGCAPEKLEGSEVRKRLREFGANL